MTTRIEISGENAAQTYSVKLGRTTYRVDVYQHGETGRYSDVMTYLTGPRGGQYFLRPFTYALVRDDGLRQVISCRTGMPLRDSRTGAEIRVYCLGNIIEVAA